MSEDVSDDVSFSTWTDSSTAGVPYLIDTAADRAPAAANAQQDSENIRIARIRSHFITCLGGEAPRKSHLYIFLYYFAIR